MGLAAARRLRPRACACGAVVFIASLRPPMELRHAVLTLIGSFVRSVGAVRAVRAVTTDRNFETGCAAPTQPPAMPSCVCVCVCVCEHVYACVVAVAVVVGGGAFRGCSTGAGAMQARPVVL